MRGTLELSSALMQIERKLCDRDHTLIELLKDMTNRRFVSTSSVPISDCGFPIADLIYSQIRNPKSAFRNLWRSADDKQTGEHSNRRRRLPRTPCGGCFCGPR